MARARAAVALEMKLKLLDLTGRFTIIFFSLDFRILSALGPVG